MLRQLLATCGTLVQLKRISPAFGFATFDHPEAVMRAIDLLNTLALPPPGVSDAVEAQEKTKKLVVKADEKTKAFVESYKAQRADRSQFEDDLDNSGRSSISQFLETLRRPDALALFADASSANASAVPSHLKDLPPEDVPEEHRSSVLGEIDKFRQASAAREEEKRRRERVLEKERMSGRSGTGAPPPSGPRGAGPAINGSSSSDPQSYSDGAAPQFVRSHTERQMQDLDPDEADELEEKRRKELKQRDDERRTQEALSAYSQRERSRLAHWNHIIDDRSIDDQRREKQESHFLQRSESWNQTAEETRELFYVDRQRWRRARGPQLRREMEEDERDAVREVEEAKRVEEETKKFLAIQEEEMRKHMEEQRRAGVLLADGAGMQPLKLKVNADAAASGPSAGSGQAVGTAAGPGATSGFKMDLDEEDGDKASGASGLRRIKVNLSDGMSTAERQAAIEKKRLEVRKSLEGLDRVDLYAQSVKWDWVDERLIGTTLKPFVSQSIVDAIGEAVPELEDVILEKVRNAATAAAAANDDEEARKGKQAALPADLEEAVEPVLAEDAGEFAESIWKKIIEEGAVASSGLL